MDRWVWYVDRWVGDVWMVSGEWMVGGEWMGGW